MDQLRDLLRRFLADEPYRRLPDDELWARFRDHREEGAFRVLLERVGGRMYARCRAVLRNDAEAEEAFQEAFCELVRHRAKLPNYRAAAAWLYQTATNKARLQRRWRLRAARRDWKVTAAPRTAQADVDEDLNRREQQEAVAVALVRLPERERQAVELVYLEGMTHDEAAAALGWSRGSVGKYVQRGLARLRRTLERRGLAAVAGVAAIEAALRAVGGDLSAERLVVLTDAVWARAAASGDPTGGWWVPGNRKLVAGLAMCLGLAGGLAWWLPAGPRPAPRPPVAETPQPLAVPAETLQARNLRVMQSEVAPQIRAILQGLFPADNPVQVVEVRAWGSEVEAEFRTAKTTILQNRPAGLKVRYCIHRRRTFLENNMNPAGEFRLTSLGAPGVYPVKLGLGLNLTLTYGERQSADIQKLLDKFPPDERAEREHLEQVFGPPTDELVLPNGYHGFGGNERELFVSAWDDSVYVRRADGRWRYLCECPGGWFLTADDRHLYCWSWPILFRLPIDRPDQPWQPVYQLPQDRKQPGELKTIGVLSGRIVMTFAVPNVTSASHAEVWVRPPEGGEARMLYRVDPAHTYAVAGDRLLGLYGADLRSRPMSDPSCDWRRECINPGLNRLGRGRGWVYAHDDNTPGPLYGRPENAGPDAEWRVVGRIREPGRDMVRAGEP
jgi:RNA polymerase sigma factor (sigma-70 family)